MSRHFKTSTCYTVWGVLQRKEKKQWGREKRTKHLKGSSGERKKKCLLGPSTLAIAHQEKIRNEGVKPRAGCLKPVGPTGKKGNTHIEMGTKGNPGGNCWEWGTLKIGFSWGSKLQSSLGKKAERKRKVQNRQRLNYSSRGRGVPGGKRKRQAEKSVVPGIAVHCPGSRGTRDGVCTRWRWVEKKTEL